MHRPLPPKTEAELLQRSNAIAGLSLAELADRHHITMPENLKREKGWGGQLIEFTLGADAGSKPVPDFTFVCAAPLTGITGEQWQTSHLRTKISKVLWVPILAERSIPLAERVVGTPFIWHLKGEQEEDLRQDWEELMDLIVLGDVKSITAKTGQYLQLRPKAAHAGIRTEAFDPSGKPIKSQPKGFYLKKDFTRRILADMFGI
jgi:DNA mismatch repair protein MutH